MAAAITMQRGTGLPGIYGGLNRMPGYQVYEYQVILAIPENIKERVRKQRLKFAEEFNWPGSKNLSLIIPLVRFRQRQLLEDKFRLALNQLVTGWRPFIVNLKDYKSQPTHSIFIPVTSKNIFQEYTRDLKSIQHLLRTDTTNNPFFPVDYQMTLAMKLPPGIYNQAWRQYEDRKFSAQFLADACLLLKRRSGEQHWQIVQRLELRDLPIGAKQGNLFE